MSSKISPGKFTSLLGKCQTEHSVLKVDSRLETSGKTYKYEYSPSFADSVVHDTKMAAQDPGG